MYNYQTYRKEQQLSRKFNQIRREHNNITIHRQKSNPTLVHSHKKRIEGFVLAMLDKPIAVTQHSNHPHQYREEDRSKNIAGNAFYLKHQTQNDRIQECMRKNSELDHIPFRNTFSHRFRESDHNTSSMKYKPLNHNFRIKEYIDSQRLNYLPNSPNQKVDRLINRSNIHNPNDRQKINKTINKSILPLLHAKTYFKSVETLFAELPKQRTGEAYEKQMTTEDSYEQGEIEIKRQVKKSNDHLSRKENSRQALLKCNMLHAKEKSDQLALSHSRSGYVGSMRA